MGQQQHSSVIAQSAVIAGADGTHLARPVGTTLPLQSYTGFHLLAGSDDALDRAAQRAALEPMVLRQAMDDGTSLLLAQWHLGTQLTFYPVTAGPVAATLRDALQRPQDMAAAGLVVQGAQGTDTGATLAVWGYCDELLQAGYPAVVQLRMAGRLADQLLQALLVQNALLTFADTLLDQRDDPLSYHNMRMPLRLVAPARGEQRATLVCLHPDPDMITLRYLAGHATPAALCRQAAAIWPDIVQAAYHTLRGDASSSGAGGRRTNRAR